MVGKRKGSGGRGYESGGRGDRGGAADDAGATGAKIAAGAEGPAGPAGPPAPAEPPAPDEDPAGPSPERAADTPDPAPAPGEPRVETSPRTGAACPAPAQAAPAGPADHPEPAEARTPEGPARSASPRGGLETLGGCLGSDFLRLEGLWTKVGGGFKGLVSFLSMSSVPCFLQARLMWPYSPQEKQRTDSVERNTR